MPIKILCVAALVSALFCAPGFAADIAITVETLSRSARSLEDAAAAVAVILPQELAAVPGAALDEKLALVSGANSFRQNGIYSFSTVVSLRGFSGAEPGRALVMLDGAPVNASATGAVNWNLLSLEEVERIEIVKGPASSLYGSNAVGGVINIITRRPHGPASGFRTEYGTFGAFSQQAAAGIRKNAFFLHLDGHYLNSPGYVSTPDSLTTAYTVKKYAIEKDIGLKAGLEFSKTSSVEAAWSYYYGQRGEGYKNLSADGNNRRFRTGSARFSWKGASGPAGWRVSSWYQNERYGRLNEYIKSGVYGRTDTDGNRTDAGASASLSLALPDNLTATAGFDYKTGRVNTTDTNLFPVSAQAEILNKESLRQYSPYAQIEKKFFEEKLNLLAGMRYDKASVFGGLYNNPTNPGWATVNGPLPENSWGVFSPKLSAGFKYSDAIRQYASYGKGFRPPGLEDLCLSLLRGSRVTLGNPGLKPEITGTFETGFRLNPAPGFSLEPAFYYTRGKNFIYEVNTGQTININGNKPVYQKRNLSGVEIYGAELDARYYTGFGLSLNAAYARSRSKITDFPFNAALEGRTLAYSPHESVSAGIEWKMGPLRLSAGWKHKSAQFTDDANTLAIGAYSVFSAGAESRINDNFTVSINADNLLNRRYLESETDKAPGRMITVSLLGGF